MKKLRHLVEYVSARILLFFFDHLPFSITSTLAKWAGTLWWWIDFGRRKVAVQNILRSGIETDPGKARKLAKKSIQAFSLVVIESLRSEEILEAEDISEHILVQIPDEVFEVLKDPDQSLILAGGHLGNWEIAAHLLSQYKPVAGI
ncbi:MAG: hypothetical protein KJT03_23200, partial [Verrucomicrobiae bacterium]|nr:hypothetical protein [Verrucomicrobiae bacterium]